MKMSDQKIKISPRKLGLELAKALNDIGFGDNKDSAWFVEEFFHRIKKYYQGYGELPFERAVELTKLLLDFQSSASLPSSIEEATVEAS